MGKDGGGNVNNYFGSILGVVSILQTDELVSLLVDGRTVWPTTKMWNDGVVDVPILAVWQINNRQLYEVADPTVWPKSGVNAVTAGLPVSAFNHSSPVLVKRHAVI